MEEKEIYNKLKEAVLNKKVVKVYYPHASKTLLPVEVHPILFRQDVRQFDFIWGFVDHYQNYQKFFLDKMDRVVVLDKEFKLREDAVYFNADQEEFIAAYPGYEDMGFIRSGNVKREQLNFD